MERIESALLEDLDSPRLVEEQLTTTDTKKVLLESYGCQMNFSDSEIIASILYKQGFSTTKNYEEADLILLNTCAIRENAEHKIRHRLQELSPYKKNNPSLLVGVMGCMAERLKTQLLEEEKIVDIVAGPDAYRYLPDLIKQAEEGFRSINVFLSKEETYADISPIRLDSNGVTAFISIMRGCNNMCSFCVVPFTRGRERSRDPETIVQEAKELFEKGYREITLLGQNVDSYFWVFEPRQPHKTVTFAQLLEKVAQIHPLLRVRFSTSHPKDITQEVLWTMKKYDNVCNYIHLPAQSGNNRILELMNRGYTREKYIEIIQNIRQILGEDCGISQDMIAGFCSETEEEHQETIQLMKEVVYDYGYMFFYSERPGTPAAKKLIDDVPLETKKKRLQEIIDLQRTQSLFKNQACIGKTFTILIENESKRSKNDWCGRTDSNKMVIFSKKENTNKGDYVNVKIRAAGSATLLGDMIG